MLAEAYNLTPQEKARLRDLILIGKTGDKQVEMEPLSEAQLLYHLLTLSKEARERVLRAAMAYDVTEPPSSPSSPNRPQ